jgi:hypothetical protein
VGRRGGRQAQAAGDGDPISPRRSAFLKIGTPSRSRRQESPEGELRRPCDSPGELEPRLDAEFSAASRPRVYLLLQDDRVHLGHARGDCRGLDAEPQAVGPPVGVERPGGPGRGRSGIAASGRGGGDRVAATPGGTRRPAAVPRHPLRRRSPARHLDDRAAPPLAPGRRQQRP